MPSHEISDIFYPQLDMVRVKEMSEERKLNKVSDEENTEELSVDQVAASTASQMENMCKFIYSKDDSNRIRTRAMLCHVYFLALHDRWYESRDLMLMSHLQENIQHSDIPTQVGEPEWNLIWSQFRFLSVVIGDNLIGPLGKTA